MVLKIRLARFGRRHAPFYNIVVAHARTARNSKPLEVLGTYDPIPRVPLESANDNYDAANNNQQGRGGGPDGNDGNGQAQGPARKFKDIKVDTIRAKYWLGVGAQPSDPAWRLFSMVSWRSLSCG